MSRTVPLAVNAAIRKVNGRVSRKMMLSLGSWMVLDDLDQHGAEKQLEVTMTWGVLGIKVKNEALYSSLYVWDRLGYKYTCP